MCTIDREYAKQYFEHGYIKDDACNGLKNSNFTKIDFSEFIIDGKLDFGKLNEFVVEDIKNKLNNESNPKKQKNTIRYRIVF